MVMLSVTRRTLYVFLYVALPRTKVMCICVLLCVYTWIALPGKAIEAIKEGGSLINCESSFPSVWATKDLSP